MLIVETANPIEMYRGRDGIYIHTPIPLPIPISISTSTIHTEYKMFLKVLIVGDCKSNSSA